MQDQFEIASDIRLENDKMSIESRAWSRARAIPPSKKDSMCEWHR